ncbi:hypothetical protein N431DRAFT_548087 [Stipitochalara longipes BDJ]|nr:hypothetical protein N431DRAFT_548087 [Stipitochalara longipes BDJ]
MKAFSHQGSIPTSAEMRKPADVAVQVKCDESKPICIRCQKLGVFCGGYRAKKEWHPSSSSTSAKVLLPKTQYLSQPSTRLFDTADEQRYFALFSDKIVAELLPYFDPSPWRYMILQACAAEPSIRHAATAIGALGKTFETAQSGRGRRPGVINHRAPALGGPTDAAQRVKGRISRREQIEGAVLHHQYALEQYQKAIKEMQNITSGNSIRTALITCIIIACFENLHGNQDSASTQLQSGIALLQEWKKNERDATKYPMGFSSPAPDVIEDYLIQFFGRLEIHAMSFRDTRPAECHIYLQEEGKEVVQQMPGLLTSINQARVYLDLITRRMMHFTAAMNHFKVSYAQYLHASSTSVAGPWIDSKLYPKVTEILQHPPSNESFHSGQQALNSEMSSWFEAFTPLLNRSIEAGGQDCISALALSITATTVSISLRAAFIQAEEDYSLFAFEFNSIVTQSALLLKTLELRTSKKKPTLAFSFDLGVIPPLYLTSVKCRVLETRKKALELLTNYPRREGLWDSVTTAALGKWVIEMEEESSDEGFVPEQSTVRKPCIAVDWLERKATMTCLKMDKETGRFMGRRKDITW